MERKTIRLACNKAGRRAGIKKQVSPHVYRHGYATQEAEVVEHFGITDLAEALGAGSRATAGDNGEGLRESDPGAEIDLFLRVHTRVWETIFAELEEGLFQPKGVSARFPLGTKRSVLVAGAPAG